MMEAQNPNKIDPKLTFSRNNNIPSISSVTVKFETEKSNVETTIKDDKPSLSKYFSQTPATPAASFFDQLTSKNESAMMTSVKESNSCQDFFDNTKSVSYNNSSIAAWNPTDLNNESLFSTESFLESAKPASDEPVVRCIFPSQDSSPSNFNISSGKTFFDMLGSGAGGSELSVPGLELSDTSSMLTSPDLTNTTEDDSFLTPTTPSIPSLAHPSEADRRRDAWIPSERTRKELISAATSSPGTYVPDKEFLTMPGVVLEEEMPDTVHEMVNHYLGEAEASKRNVLTVNDVTHDERGLRELIQAGCFRAAINLTGRLLTMYGQGAGRVGHPSKHTVNSIQLWFTRIALHVKLRSFSLAEVESEPFGNLDNPDLYFQFYPELYGGRMGSMAPFAFRLLLAELPQYLGKSQEALIRLHSLLSTIRKILANVKRGRCEDGSPVELSANDKNEATKLWKTRETRVLHSIVNSALYQKDYNLAVEVLELILSDKEMSQHHRRALQSALGRVYLQLGDVSGAEKSFTLARELRQHHNAISSSPDIRDLIDKGLMAVAQNAFQEAYEYFHQAYLLDPANVMLVNNMGVCLLYLGRLHDALELLEKDVRDNPARGLHESVLLNVCTLYELQSSLCKQKKLDMLSLLGRYKGDGVYVNCLKLQV